MGITPSIRQKIQREVFDYRTVLAALSEYKKPRDKLTRLLADRDIVRIKKGLYCFGEAFRKEPVDRAYLANLILGPSYISLEYALSYHGLIPERVESVTSVTTQRSRDFHTPFGHFSYTQLRIGRYALGAHLETSGKARFLMASPEKALIDLVWQDKRFTGTRIDDYEAYLFEDLRIEEHHLKALDPGSFGEIVRAYRSPKIERLGRFLERLEERSHA